MARWETLTVCRRIPRASKKYDLSLAALLHDLDSIADVLVISWQSKRHRYYIGSAALSCPKNSLCETYESVTPLPRILVVSTYLFDIVQAILKLSCVFGNARH